MVATSPVTNRPRERGSSGIAAILIMSILLLGMTTELALLSATVRRNVRVVAERQAEFLADAGIAAAQSRGAAPNLSVAGALDTGTYAARVFKRGDQLLVRSEGTAGNIHRTKFVRIAPGGTRISATGAELTSGR